ncbi:hypothetical protein E4P47_08120, partial [Porphyromonas levii]
KTNYRIYMERITLVGFLGSDAKIVEIEGVEKYIQVSLAPVRKKQQDDKSLLWYQLNLPLGLRKLVEYLKKGSLIGVTGRFRITAYLDKYNNATPSCVVFVDQVDLLGKKEETASQQLSEPINTAPVAPRAINKDDELPY